MIKIGSKVRIKGTGEILYVHANKRGKPFPFYLHSNETVSEKTILRGPYGKDEIEEVND